MYLRSIIFSIAVLYSPLAMSATVSVSYTAQLGFDPTSTVGAGGQNAATLVDQLFGPGIGASGTIDVTGSFVWETNTPALNTNARGAGYTNAITDASISWASQTATANIAEIQNNAGSSEIGYNTNEFGGFCGSRESCAFLGQPFTPTGNLVQTGNNTNFFILRNSNRVDYSNRDFLSFAIGDTASNAEFEPTVSTASFGDVSINSTNLFFVSTAAASLRNNVTIPTDNSFLTSPEVETASLFITFNGDQLLSDLEFSGSVSSFLIQPTTPIDPAAPVNPTQPDQPHIVPLPVGLPLLLSSFGFLGLLGLRRKQ